MIKKIICPTDFSGTANNAIEYAAKLSQELNAELQIINIQHLFPVVALPVGLNIHERVVEAAGILKETCSEINKLFHISCTYEIEATSESLTKSIANYPDENNLIVMGTNGVDSMYQYFFGSNTYNVIKKTRHPILLVPEDTSYSSIRKIVFAWDYDSHNKLVFSKLNTYISIFNPQIIFSPQIIFLHISKQDSEVSKEVFKSQRNEIEEALNTKKNIEFEYVISNDIAESINDYMLTSQADILMISGHNRGIISSIFHRSVTKKLSETAGYPILVLHA